MKFLIPLICLLIVQVSYAAEDPAALVELRQGWEESRTEAQQRVDKLYFDELEEMKKNFTQARNIAAAIAVDNVIKGGEKADNEPEALSKTRAARDRSLKKALTPLDKKFWQDLKKLKENFIKEGKLAGVVAADAEIKKVLAAYKKPPKAKKQNAQAKADRDQEAKADKMKDFEMEFAVIGNPNNEADDTGYGAVSYTYRMGKHEVSEAMIDAYNKHSGMPAISMDSRGPNKPATKVTWNEAARFVNWLNTRQGHQAAYKFTTGGANDNIALWSPAEAWQQGGENLFRHKDAKYFLPSEDEWYKAAYYDPKANGGKSGYWDYATGSDSVSMAVGSGTTAGTAVYDGQSGPADITNAGGLSPYGIMAQNGNSFEWNESAYTGDNDSAVESRVVRGGSWRDTPTTLQSSYRANDHPDYEVSFIGFRVTSVAE